MPMLCTQTRLIGFQSGADGQDSRVVDFDDIGPGLNEID